MKNEKLKIRTDLLIRAAIFGLLIAMIGCGAKPQIDVFLEPISGREGIQIDETTNAVSTEQNGIRIQIEPLNEVEIYDLTIEDEINPYLKIGRWGKVDPLYTVFEIRVKNFEHDRVVVGDTAILIDENGDQFASLPYDYFKDLYDNARTTVAYRGYSPYSNPYGGGYYDPYYNRSRTYRSHNNSAIKDAKIVVRETIFDGGKLFPGGRRSGLIIFDLLSEDAKDLKLIIPEVMAFDQNELKSKTDFTFDFRQILQNRKK